MGSKGYATFKCGYCNKEDTLTVYEYEARLAKSVYKQLYCSVTCASQYHQYRLKMRKARAE